MYKYLKYSIFFLLFLCFSCQKENVNVAQNQQPATTTETKSMFDAFYEMPFTEDFLIAKEAQAEWSQTKTYGTQWNLRSTSNSRDQAELSTSFPGAKSTIMEMAQDNKNDQYTGTIQVVSLRYLRRFLLTTESSENRQHALDLLEVLVQTKAIDLDVLVDTYLYTIDSMTSNQRAEFLNYLVALYKHDINYIQTQAPELKKSYETSSGREKQKYLLWGKALERRSHACAYAREKLPQLTTQ